MSADLHVRDADPSDGATLERLIAQLGYPTPANILVERMQRVTADGNGRVIVACRGKNVIGVITIYPIRTIHRPGDICRITALVIDEAERGGGAGRALVAEVERHARATGCVRVEVTSAAPRTGAHDFYTRLGYIEYPKRFIKDL